LPVLRGVAARAGRHEEAQDRNRQQQTLRYLPE